MNSRLSIKGILWGAGVSFIGCNFFAFVAVLFLGRPKSAYDGLLLLVLSLWLSAACGGYVAAEKSAQAHLLNGVLSSFLVLCFGIIAVHTAPLYAGVALIPLFGLLGGYIKIKAAAASGVPEKTPEQTKIGVKTVVSVAGYVVLMCGFALFSFGAGMSGLCAIEGKCTHTHTDKVLDLIFFSAPWLLPFITGFWFSVEFSRKNMILAFAVLFPIVGAMAGEYGMIMSPTFGMIVPAILSGVLSTMCFFLGGYLARFKPWARNKSAHAEGGGKS